MSIPLTSSRIRKIIFTGNLPRIIYILHLYFFLFVVLSIICNLIFLYFDGAYFMVVARNLALKGNYASDFFLFDPYITVGYPVIAPMALIFKFFSVGVIQGRIVAVLYFLTLLTALYFLPQKLALLDKKRGLLALGLTILLSLFTIPNFIVSSSNTMGEIPALSFYLLSLILLMRFFKSRNLITLFFVGILLGLAFSTKYVMILSIASTLFSFIFFNVTEKSKHVAKYLAIIIFGIVIPEFSFQLYHFITVGPIQFISDIENLILNYRELERLSFANYSTGNLMNHLLVLKSFNFLSYSFLIILFASIIGMFYFARKKEYIVVNMCLFVVLSYFWWFFVTPNTILRHIMIPQIIVNLLLSVFMIKLSKKTFGAKVRKPGTAILLIIIAGITIIQTSTKVFFEYNAPIKRYIESRDEQRNISNFMLRNPDVNYYFVNTYILIPQLSFMTNKKIQKYWPNKSILNKSVKNYLILGSGGKCQPNKIILRTKTYIICNLN